MLRSAFDYVSCINFDQIFFIYLFRLSQEFAEIDMEYVDNFQYRTSIENLPFPIYDTITEYLQEFR